VAACWFPRGLRLACLVPPLIVMSLPQEHRRPSRREKIKSFIRNPRSIFSSNSWALSASQNSRAHDSSPNTPNVDVGSASSSRPTSISPANVSSRTDLLSGNDTASTPKSALGATGPGKRVDYTWLTSNASILLADYAAPSDVVKSTLTGSRSRTVHATGNVMSHAPPQIADHIGLGE
jgi:hypothetical protein